MLKRPSAVATFCGRPLLCSLRASPAFLGLSPLGSDNQGSLALGVRWEAPGSHGAGSQGWSADPVMMICPLPAGDVFSPGSSGELPACTQMPRKGGRLTASLPFTKGESELQSPGHLGLHCLTRSAWEGRPLRPQSRTPSHLSPHLLGHQIPLPHALPHVCTMVQALVHLSENLCPRSANLELPRCPSE